MLLTSDKSYQDTKRVKQGRAKMNPDFEPLAHWIDNKYGVKTINIIYDMINDGKTPCLLICFESVWEEEIFLNSNRTMNAGKQQDIAQAFAGIIEVNKLPYQTTDLRVIYGAFEPVAKADIVGKITGEEIKALQEELHDENLWLIMVTPFGGRPGFFLYTDEQVKAYTGSDIAKQWTDRFYDLIKKYDEFGYVSREDFSIYLDSKENLDTNYQGNWYYYFK